MVAGLLLIACIAVVLSTADAGTNVWLLRVILFVMGFGVAAVFLPSQAAGFATIGPAKTSVASTIFNAQRMIGGAIGVALLTAVISALHPVRVVAGRPEANIHAFHTGLRGLRRGRRRRRPGRANDPRPRRRPDHDPPRRPSRADAAALPGEGATAASTD